VSYLGEHLQHGGILCQNIGRKSFDILSFGYADQVLEMERAYAPILPILVRGESDLGEVGMRITDASRRYSMPPAVELPLPGIFTTV